ncbi:MAG TPA: WYL domain-containing protein [Candidatus Paceibacterota bacterium]|nr:WYL domain-containing protein [Verrucomicrobiota bacterium]HSA08973.1 WYL domain-containing protein [Candidatus Paceibacterota bacterium]
MERMLRLHQLLQNQEYPNCSKLGREFELCTRTVKRDVDFMKYRLDLPIEYDAHRNGYYYTRPVDHFPGAAVTEAEMFALLVAHKAIAQYSGTPFQQPLETAFRKLTGQLDQSVRFTMRNLDEVLSFRPFAPEDSDLETFQIVTRALRTRRGLKFLYRNVGVAKARRRLVHPYHLACIENHWYLFAFDVKRQDMRTFALVRLQQPELTGERFTMPARFDPNEYLRGSFTVFKGGADYEVMIEFDAWATDLIRGRRWHPTQELTELPGGCSRLRLRLNNIEEMERWVLGWGRHATVLQPKALAARLGQTATELQKRYAGPRLAQR